MHVVVTCTRCSRQLRLDQEVIGSTVRCPLCQTTFLTRARGEDRADAIPLANNPSPPDLDDIAEAPLLTDDEEILDALPARAAPRRAALRDDRSRRSVRQEEDQRASSALLSFPIFVHHDPDDFLHGRFEAEIAGDGLYLWRGKGRTLHVPLGASVEYLGRGRLLLSIEGRKVELTPIHPDGLNDELARAVAAFLEQRSDGITLPRRPHGPVVWLALLPLGLPLLVLFLGRAMAGVAGLVAWSSAAVALALLCLPFLLMRNWAPATRAWIATGISLAGYLALGIGLRIDHELAPPPIRAEIGPWRAFAPLDSGYRVEMPGLPERQRSTRVNLPAELNAVHSVTLPDDTVFLVGHADAPDNDPQQRLNRIFRTLASVNLATVVSVRHLSLDGKPGLEAQLESFSGLRSRKFIARFYVSHQRVFCVLFASPTRAPDSPEARRFLDSFAFDDTTGWVAPKGNR